MKASVDSAKECKTKYKKSDDARSKAEEEAKKLAEERERLMEKRITMELEQKKKDDRIPVFEELLLKRHELVMRGLTLLQSNLLSNENIEAEFQRAHYPSMPAPDEATGRDVVELKTGIVELESAVGRIDKRCNTDGLYVAMRAILQQNAWKPRQLAEQIVQGPHALKLPDSPKDVIAYEQLVHFFERRQVTHTPSAIGFLLQKCGSSSKSKKPMKIDKFVESFEKLVPTPLDVGRMMGLGALGGSWTNEPMAVDGDAPMTDAPSAAPSSEPQVDVEV